MSIPAGAALSNGDVFVLLLPPLAEYYAVKSARPIWKLVYARTWFLDGPATAAEIAEPAEEVAAEDRGVPLPLCLSANSFNYAIMH